VKTREKLTSGTLYSVFKEPRPRAQSPEAAPDRRREARKNVRLAADLPAYEILAGLVNLKARAPRLEKTRRLTPEEALGKIQPLRGTGI
jgi:hypothetical protein